MNRTARAAAVVLALLTVLAPSAGAGISAAVSPLPRPSIKARHAGAYEVSTGAWLYEKAADQPTPVASLSKLAAALTFRRLTPDLDQLVTITREDWTHSGRTKLRVGDRVPARTLLKLALVASDNCAARALAHPFGLGPEAFAETMRETARSLGCRQAEFVEPTGLDPRNVATVREVVVLFTEAMKDTVLRAIMGTHEFTLATSRGPRPIVHSSRLLRYRRDILAAKTGYIDAAGYCLVEWVKDERGDVVTVVLGAPTKGARIRESLRLIDYTRRMRGRNS